MRRFRADKSMGAEKAAEKQAAKKYRKTMAWYKARSDAETGQTPPKVMPIPGPRPGEKATKSEGLSIEDRIREIREAASKEQRDAGLKATLMKRRKEGDDYWVTDLKGSRDARDDIQDRMPAGRKTTSGAVTRHMAREYVRRVPVKGSAEAKKIADKAEKSIERELKQHPLPDDY